MPGSLLWNNQTQRPEWVRADEIPARLASGAYRSYESSGAVAAGTGQVVPAEGVRSYSAVGGEADDSVRGDIGGAEARRAQLDAYSGLDQKILTAVDGAVNAVSVGLVDGFDSNAGIRAEANPGSRIAGAVGASLLSTFAPIGPSSALFAGAQRAGAGAARALTGKALDYSLRSAAAKATGMAVEGAVEAGAYAAGSQIANAINGRPVSGEAIINDIGLGAALGGAIGAPVAALGARAGRRVASVRAADDALPALRAVGDGAAVWGGAHARLEQSYKLYADLVQDGALGDGGEQLLLPRRNALQDAERARKRLFRAAGRAKDFGGVSSYMDRLVHSGKASDVQEFFGALDAYGVAVGRLDELMRPGARDADVLAGLAGPADTRVPDELLTPPSGTPGATPGGFSFSKHFEAQGKSLGEGLSGLTPDDARRVAAEGGVRFAPDTDDVNWPAGTTPGGIYKPKTPGPGDAVATGAGGPAAKRAAAAPAESVEPAPDFPPLPSPGRMEEGLIELARDRFVHGMGSDRMRAPWRVWKEAGAQVLGKRPLGGVAKRVAKEGLDADGIPWIGMKGPDGKNYLFPDPELHPDLFHKAFVKAYRRGEGMEFAIKHAKDWEVDLAGGNADVQRFMRERLDARREVDFSAGPANDIDGGAPANSNVPAPPPSRDPSRVIAGAIDAPAVATPIPRRPGPNVVVDPELVPVPTPVPGSRKTAVRPRHLDAVEFWDKEARRAGFKGALELGADMDAVLSRIDTASNGRLGSEALKAVAEELGVNLARVSGPLAERGVALWALRKIATSVSAGRGTAMHRLSRRAMEAVGGVAGWGLGGGIVGAALGREVGRIAADRVLGPVSRLVQAQGLLRLRAGDSVARMLSPRRVSRATFVALVKPVEASYNPDNPRRTRKFEEKAEDLRAAMGNPERVRERIRENTRELALVDPMGALNAEDVAMTRLRNLHRRLPKFMLPAMLGQPIPPPVDEIAEWELYEAITNDPTLAAQLVSAGRIDDTIVEALAEQHPEFRAEMLKAVLERREELERADHRTQAALGRLLGLNLVPEVDPAYVQRVQIDYDEQAEERAAKTPQPGAAGMSPNQLPGAIPTPAIVYATPVPNR